MALEKIFGPNWKSTVAGLLNLFSVTLGVISAWLAASQGIHVAADITAGIALASQLCNAWIHFLMTDN